MSGLRAIIVEDHPALREGLGLLLQREGCVVVGAAGDIAGTRTLRGLAVDVWLVDVHLDGATGIELARELLAEDPDRAIVLYTGSTDAELLYEGMRVGARGYALKDGSAAELFQAMRIVAGGGDYVDPRLRPALLADPVMRRRVQLSPREREIVALLAEGLNGEQIADRLVLSSETIRTHVRNAMTKSEASTRVHLIALALRDGEIEPAVAGSGRAA